MLGLSMLHLAVHHKVVAKVHFLSFARLTLLNLRLCLIKAYRISIFNTHSVQNIVIRPGTLLLRIGLFPLADEYPVRSKPPAK